MKSIGSVTVLSQQTHLSVVLLILALGVAMTAAVLLLRRSGKAPQLCRLLPRIVLAAYLAAFLWLTLAGRRSMIDENLKMEFLWSYREAFSLEGGFRVVRLGIARQILLNILVMIPLGYMLPLVLENARHPLRWTALCGFALSLLVELLQYVMHLGYLELDDLFNNTLGCLIGIGIFILLKWGIGRIPIRET